MMRNTTVEGLANGSLEQSDLSEQLNIPQSGAFTDQLEALEAAGFIKRDYAYNISSEKSSTSKYDYAIIICDFILNTSSLKGH